MSNIVNQGREDHRELRERVRPDTVGVVVKVLVGYERLLVWTNSIRIHYPFEKFVGTQCNMRCVFKAMERVLSIPRRNASHVVFEFYRDLGMKLNILF